MSDPVPKDCEIDDLGPRKKQGALGLPGSQVMAFYFKECGTNVSFLLCVYVFVRVI